MTFLSPDDLPDPGIKPMSPESAAFAGEFFTTEPPGKPLWLEAEGTNPEPPSRQVG